MNKPSTTVNIKKRGQPARWFSEGERTHLRVPKSSLETIKTLAREIDRILATGENPIVLSSSELESMLEGAKGYSAYHPAQQPLDGQNTTSDGTSAGDDNDIYLNAPAQLLGWTRPGLASLSDTDRDRRYLEENPIFYDLDISDFPVAWVPPDGWSWERWQQEWWKELKLNPGVLYSAFHRLISRRRIDFEVAYLDAELYRTGDTDAFFQLLYEELKADLKHPGNWWLAKFIYSLRLPTEIILERGKRSAFEKWILLLYPLNSACKEALECPDDSDLDAKERQLQEDLEEDEDY